MDTFNINLNNFEGTVPPFSALPGIAATGCVNKTIDKSLTGLYRQDNNRRVLQYLSLTLAALNSVLFYSKTCKSTRMK